MSEDSIEGKAKAIRDEIDWTAPADLSVSTEAARSQRPRRSSWVRVARLTAVVVLAGVVAVFVSLRLALPSHADPTFQATSLLPRPIPRPITRTTAGAQVAWLRLQSPGPEPKLIAIDPSGRLVAHVGSSTASGMADVSGFWRSPDDSEVFAVNANQITSYSALDGKAQRTYSRTGGDVVGDAFSPDGRWLALLIFRDNLQLQVIDLQTGAAQIVPIVHDPNAKLPGLRGPANSGAWGLPVFAPDSVHLYTLTDWGGPARLTAFGLPGGNLTQIATAVDGQKSRKFGTCAGPAMAAKVVAAGQTLVAFCHADGAVWFFDLTTLTNADVVQPQQSNPFWLSPIFTPDSQLLYLHQWPGFGDSVQVLDLTTRKLFGPAPMPTKVDRAGPFARLIASANAGGVASTVPVSPDGLKLYSATGDGVMVLRVPDLKPLARLAPGLIAGEVWVSGDGRTMYATADEGKRLLVMRDDGTDQKTVTLPNLAGGFIASEHG